MRIILDYSSGGIWAGTPKGSKRVKPKSDVIWEWETTLDELVSWLEKMPRTVCAEICVKQGQTHLYLKGVRLPLTGWVNYYG